MWMLKVDSSSEFLWQQILISRDDISRRFTKHKFRFWPKILYFWHFFLIIRFHLVFVVASKIKLNPHLCFYCSHFEWIARSSKCWCILTTLKTDQILVFVCWFSSFWWYFDLVKQARFAIPRRFRENTRKEWHKISRHFRDNVWEKWAEICYVNLYPVISPEMKKANFSTYKFSSYRAGGTPDYCVVRHFQLQSDIMSRYFNISRTCVYSLF